MRARIVELDANRATLTHDDEITGERVTREFWAPSDGGYVREVTESRPGTLGLQVCDRLSHSGSTLHWSGHGSLVSMIRREWRKRRSDWLSEERL